MGNLGQRIVTGAGLILLVVVCLRAGFVPFSLLFFVLMLVGLYEFYNMASPKAKWLFYVPNLLVATLIYFLCAGIASGLFSARWMMLIVPTATILFVIELYRKRENPFQYIALRILGLIYVAMPFSLVNYMVFLPEGTYNWEPVLGSFIFLWISDSGAYVVGRAFGRTKLFERISPKKTLEGSIGGVVLTLVVGYFLVPTYLTSLSAINWLVIALLVSVSGIFGDLIESLLKRSFEKKDSGRILPGHGGVLDRFDSFILAAPLVYAFLELVSK